MRKFRIEHAVVLLFIGFLLVAPITATASNSILAQDGTSGDQLFQNLLTNGAEVIYSSIDDQGVPAVIYGQLGIPSDTLQLSSSMYDGCLAMAMVSTHGEFLNMVLGMIGGSTLSGDSGSNFTLAQTSGGAFDPNQIIDMLGTEFNLLITIYVNVDQATSQSRMNSVVSLLSGTPFEFSLTSLFSLRIDQNTFPPDANITLPFNSIDIYIYQETHTFDVALNAMFGVMNSNGFLGSIDTSKFTNLDTAPAAAAGLIAIPDMAELVDLINSFGGGTSGGDGFLPTLAQTSNNSLLDIQGPLVVAAAGYLGNQVLSSGDTSLSISTLIGSTGSISPLPTANSVIVVNLPDNCNVTSISPDVVNESYYDPEQHMVMWNATALGTQPDYIINFEADFPPMVTLQRTFSPDTTTPGGSTTVTVTVTNEGTDPISNLVITDDQLASTYSSVSVSGSTSNTIASLAGGASATLTYTVSFTNEGGYTFYPARISYEYQSNTYQKSSVRQQYTVTPDVAGLLINGLLDGMPYTGVAVGIVVLVGIYSIAGIFKSRGKGTFQV
jgi:hypothetical protein